MSCPLLPKVKEPTVGILSVVPIQGAIIYFFLELACFY
ncbi:MAG: hypothetical protein ACJAZ4_000143 [Neptuniibacter pectenicola]|jgi:hypothetical protein